MDVLSVELRSNIVEWDEGDVHAWFTTLGLPQYENQIRCASATLCLSTLMFTLYNSAPCLWRSAMPYGCRESQRNWHRDHRTAPGNLEGRVPAQARATDTDRCGPLRASLCVFSYPIESTPSNYAIAEVEERQEHLNLDRMYDLLRDQGMLLT